MKIDFKVPEKFVHDVGVGQSAEIRIDAFKDRVFLASVEAVDSKVDPDSHSLALRATTDNDNGELFAGLFANVSLIIGERGNTVMVDESAIVREGTIETVWVIEKGKARQKLVKTGVREKNMVEISAGINQTSCYSIT
jgi:membrane fusion protein (multidrug efflux system)